MPFLIGWIMADLSESELTWQRNIAPQHILHFYQPFWFQSWTNGQSALERRQKGGKKAVESRPKDLMLNFVLKVTFDFLSNLIKLVFPCNRRPFYTINNNFGWLSNSGWFYTVFISVLFQCVKWIKKEVSKRKLRSRNHLKIKIYWAANILIVAENIH